MGTPIIREGGYFIRAGRKAKGYRVDEETYKKFEALRLIQAFLFVSIILVIMFSKGFIPMAFYSSLNAVFQAGLMVVIVLFAGYVLFNINWYFEGVFVRKMKTVDEGVPFIQRRYENTHRYWPVKWSFWIFLFLSFMNLYIFWDSGFDSQSLFIALILMLSTAEYGYYHFFHKADKKED
ncbi:hypothetical protein KFE96_16245 [Kordiimonas sp. SCSIO 12603]|uniref:hypothetical protein n=1 Tax=Kordiimonas sp. SCSIO 12603 TaxID=2829596 RepID=UPI002105FC74|nr:hypothetical protein [Kordiimonas sp. SCSIO 12603]UTW58351.1 hypothetical protein KFE96_16245 [Kordiimonas sp. SCSIO 12603]